MYSIDGFQFSGIHSGIKKSKLDLGLVYAKDGASFALVTTTNKFAAPGSINARAVQTSQDKLEILMVNSGNANALTGKKGLNDIHFLLKNLGSLLKFDAKKGLLFSTGIIGKNLPLETITNSYKKLVSGLKNDAAAFSEAICTTDLVQKVVHKKIIINNEEINILGTAKGSGMIQPNMATMLAFIFTDATISSSSLRKMIKKVTAESFHRITVDSDSSTNDTFMILASNKKQKISQTDEKFLEALCEVAAELAKKIIEDGEGCTKFVEIQIQKAKSKKEARDIFYAIANSPLVKTAIFGENPNFGRILCSAGKIKSSLVADKVDLYFGSYQLVKGGTILAYEKNLLDKYMKNKKLLITLDLNIGSSSFSGWTTDLSYDYVKINAEYN
ncbi:MAG: bifunctional glutamate N-acetyltransferase/amino-acid acetyltransferase ArgJ [Candidatus Margulisbacteria bacterium]|nr:bifunctional glutamate N-acetyltransferase/amino-acid acetyltransferase ArgJ [Candidatus Margulisiibacteriota bacterium]